MNVSRAVPARIPMAPSDRATRIVRGVVRQCLAWGYAPLTEVVLTNRRRADVMGLSPSGEGVIVEVKSGSPDFRADGKWREYLGYCDSFAFAVDSDFPRDVLPDTVGLLVSDGFEAVALRPWRGDRLHAGRRKASRVPPRGLSRSGVGRTGREAPPRHEGGNPPAIGGIGGAVVA